MSAFNGSPQVGGITNVPRRTYITTTAFNNDFYTYTTTLNPTTFVTTGTLAANIVGATAVTCPANRILRENGRRLYPSANPGVSTLMVGVYDAITGFKGFIDPNAPPFAIYNTDKSYQTDNGINPNGGLLDQGPPIYTRGFARILGGLDVSGGFNVIGGMMRNSDITPLTTITGSGAQTAQTIDPNLGEIFTLTSSASGAASITLNGANITSTTGARVTILITATTVQNLTITFGTGFFKTATLVVTAGAGPVNQYYTISFISNGTNLYELSRTAAQT